MGVAGSFSQNSGDADITHLLHLWQGGDHKALAELFYRMYPQLRDMASARMRLERQDHTIQPTALVSELYLRLADCDSVDWKNRSHFLAVASRVMRHFLIDYARRRASRNGSRSVVKLDLADLNLPADVSLAGALEVNDLLDQLAIFDPRAAQVFEMRCFGGLTHEEAAHVLGYTEQTMKRDWRAARAWLIAQLRRGAGNDSQAMGAG